ncbi:MAG: hypothetical protein K2V71_00735 [Methylotenera sp.]|nr:hypothetical protein [Methylotenera sp.]
MGALDNFVGQQLESTYTDNGELGLRFSEATLAIFNPVSGSAPECSIGAKVRSVEFFEKQMFALKFNNQTEIVISLKENDYIGPEAFCASFSNGVIVVE